MRLWIDGELEANGSSFMCGLRPGVRARNYVGRGITSTQGVHASIIDVRAWNVALQPNEIDALARILTTNYGHI